MMPPATTPHRTPPSQEARPRERISARAWGHAHGLGARVRLRSSPRHYDASTMRLSPPCTSAPEQDFLESMLAFSSAEKEIVASEEKELPLPLPLPVTRSRA